MPDLTPKLWPFPARQPGSEVLEWRTDILASREGEQRIALRPAPRETLTCRHLLDAAGMARAAELARGVFGVTATPNRGDRKGLREVFDNVADQVRLGELIASGHLVPPRTFVIDVGVQDELRKVRKTIADYDMTQVAEIMDHTPVTDEVIRHWKEKAGERPTVVFCSTVAHAENVAAAFNAAGASAAVIHGDLAAEERRNILAAYATGDIRVIVNVAVLTEGWRLH